MKSSDIPRKKSKIQIESSKMTPDCLFIYTVRSKMVSIKLSNRINKNSMKRFAASNASVITWRSYSLYKNL